MKNIEEKILETCRAMVDDDGVDAISVRKLVNRAGCSLRSLYNKFENLGSVYAVLMNEFSEDIAGYVSREVNDEILDDDGLYRVHESFLSYFLQHPNRFSFMYLHRHSEKDNLPRVFETDEFRQRVLRSYDYLRKGSGVSQIDVERLHGNLIYGVFGLLTLYFTGNFRLSADAVRTEFRTFFSSQMSILARE